MATTADEGRMGTVAKAADSAARSALIIAGGFLLLAALLHVLASLKLAYPSFVPGVAILSYGRLIPMAQTATVFGWLTFSNLAIVYFLLPRLTGAQLWNETLATITTVASAGLTALAVVTVGMGITDGRPLADFHVIADVLLVATYLVPLAIVVQTIRRRTETSTYISLYYVLAGLVWLTGAMITGNVPGEGVAALVQNQFFSSTLVAQWAVGVGIGAAYYIVPKATGNPLFSRSLALVGFWSLAISNLWAGAANLVYGPTSDAAETIGVVFAFGMIIPALALLANIVGTMSGSWDSFRTNPAVRFAVLGAVVTTFVAFVAGVQGFRTVSAIIGLTPFGIGTQFATIWGSAGLFAYAFGYHAVPRLNGRKLFSMGLAEMHLRLVLVGTGLVAGAYWIAGLATGYTWVGAAYAGFSAAAGEDFVATSTATSGLYGLAALGMFITAAGAELFVYNMWRTYSSGESTTREVLMLMSEEANA